VAIGTGQSGVTYRFSARYAKNPHGFPATFAIKLSARDDTVRDRVSIGCRSECAFYSTVAHHVQVPTPQCFYCEIAEVAVEYAFLLADQAPALQGDQLAGCGEHEARLAVTALAGLHGPSWCDPIWLDFPGIAFTRPDEASAKGLGEVARMSAEITLDKLGERTSATDRETFDIPMGLVTAHMPSAWPARAPISSPSTSLALVLSCARDIVLATVTPTILRGASRPIVTASAVPP
jgi:hypothetical protein